MKYEYKVLQPTFFDGPEIPGTLFSNETENISEGNVVSGDESDLDAESLND